MKLSVKINIGNYQVVTIDSSEYNTGDIKSNVYQCLTDITQTLSLLIEGQTDNQVKQRLAKQYNWYDSVIKNIRGD